MSSDLPTTPARSPATSSVSTSSADELEESCAAFARRDVYGALGSGPLPVEEKVLITLALVTLVPLRILAGISLVFLYYSVCKICTLFHDPSPEDGPLDHGHVTGWRREVIVTSGRFLSRVMLFVMGFYSIRENRVENRVTEESEEHGRPGVIISNHVSYIDVLYHMSSSFPSFVAKRSVAGLPLVGIISKCLGCVYVQRESRSSDSKGISGVVIERILKANQNGSLPMLMIFPEGTTTNGEFLLPFKGGAFLAKAPVLPVILKYPYDRFNPAWESISGVRHMILLLCQFVNHLEVMHLPVYYPSHKEKDDPKLYANNVRKLMAAEVIYSRRKCSLPSQKSHLVVLHPMISEFANHRIGFVQGNLTLSEIGLAEKREYIASLNGKTVPHTLHHKLD